MGWRAYAAQLWWWLLVIQLRAWAAGSSCDDACQQEQLTAVTALFAELNVTAQPSATAQVQNPSYCSWAGITCCVSSSAGPTLDLSQGFPSSLPVPCIASNAISALILSSFNMTGKLPERIWQPLAFALEYIDLTGNNLTSTIPASMSLLSELKVLRMGYNQLHGSIPAAIFQNCTLANSIILNRNQLTGTLPAMGNMLRLTQFDLVNNELSGSLPMDWSASPLLSTFGLSNNRLTGSIPPPLPANLYAEYSANLLLLLRNNRLSGSIPPNLSLLPIITMDMGQNALTGPLDELNNMASLSLIRVDYNNMSGSIPEAAFQRAEVFEASNNKLTGTIPSMVNAPLRIVALPNNLLTGTLPAVDSGSQLNYLRLVNEANATLPAGQSNALGQSLPPYLIFVKGQYISSNVPYMQCPVVTGNPKTNSILARVQIDPGYFGYSGCLCTSSYHLRFDDNGVAFCKYVPAPKWKLMVPLFVVGLVLIAIVGRYTAKLAVHSGGQTLYTLGPDKSVPPDEGQPLTLVMTDVEGSTELWEWDTEVMMQAQALHDSILRKLLRKYHGYEVMTEGDSFLVAFHLPIDALAWCAATQQALLAAAWPLQLQDHPSTQIRLHHGADSSVNADGHALVHSESINPPKLKDVQPRDILFWGLNVRMCAASGICEKRMVNATSKRTEFLGSVMNTAKGMSDMPYGGQIIMDEKTFEGVKLMLADLYDMLPHGPNAESMERNCREAGSQLDFHALQSAPSDMATFRQLSSLMNVENSVQDEVDAPQAAASSGQRLARSPLSRGSWMSSFRSSMSDLLRRKNSLSDAMSISMGSREASRGLHRTHTIRVLGSLKAIDSVYVLDMGIHMMSKLKGAHLIVQLLVPGLEERARALPALPSLHHTAGYFDAPAAYACPLRRKQRSPLPDVTMVFSTIEGLPLMKAANEAATEVVLMLYRNEIRRLLSNFGGYECSETGGEFMLAFESPLSAAHFCLEVQDVMMQAGTGWSQDVLALPNCGPQISESGVLIWYGPRVRMGMCKGTPTSVVPHITSGRTDYFGPFVNRAARFANCAARGGQIMLPLAVANTLIEEWTGRSIMLAATKPVRLQPPEYEPEPATNPLPQWVPEPAVLSSTPGAVTRNLSAQQWSSKIRNSTAGKAANGMLHRVTSKGQHTIRLAADLEPAGSSEVMLAAHERDSRSCPEFLMTALANSPTGSTELYSDAQSAQLRAGAREVVAALRRKSEATLVPGISSRVIPAQHHWAAESRTSLDSRGKQLFVPLGQRLVHRHWSPGSPPGSVAVSARPSTDSDGRDQGGLRAHGRSSGMSSSPGTIFPHSAETQEVFFQECGTCRFKGVQELQVVVSLSAGQLAHRTFPPAYPSSKAALIAPFKGLLAVVALPGAT